MNPRIAYFVNQYPKVSHTFIRREVLALERQGFDVARIALRGWDSQLVDKEDQEEQKRTRYVLQKGALPLCAALVRELLTHPVRLLFAAALGIRAGWRAQRPLLYHLLYLAEACLILPWLKSLGATHVHAHFGTNSTDVVMLAHALGGPPYSFTVHGPEEFDKAQALGIKEKVRRSAFVVAISSYGRSQLYRWIEHSDWRKVKVVHCGLEAAFFETGEIRPPNAPRLVCVGRLCEQKGQLLLVEAAARLAGKRIPFELVLAGDGEMRSDIEALIDKHRLAKAVRITGWISNNRVREEILAARGLVLPSFAEGLPIAIMEAMALGRPVLATYVAGIPELVQAGRNGWLVPPGDIDALTGAMEDFLTRAVDELKIMGAAARARAMERHSVDSAAKRLGSLFQECRSDLA